MGDDFRKFKAVHAVFGAECPYSLHERAVAVVLILDRDEARGCAYRGQEGIAARAGISRRQVQRALASLMARDDGPLIVRAERQGQREGSGGRAPNAYFVDLRAPLAHNGQGVTRPPGAQAQKVERLTDAQPGGVTRQAGAQRGDLCAKPGGTCAPESGGLCAHQAQDLGRELERELDPPQPPNGGRRRDRLAESFVEAHPDDLWAFDRWREAFGKTGAKLDDARGRILAERRAEGMSRQDVADVLEGAKGDDWLGKQRYELRLIFGTRDRYERYLEDGRATRGAGARVSPEARATADAAYAKRRAWMAEKARRERQEDLGAERIAELRRATEGTGDVSKLLEGIG
jgi:hypothetical protein